MLTRYLYLWKVGLHYLLPKDGSGNWSVENGCSSEHLRQDMGRTIAGLLDPCGLRLLEQPLRLEGWLRDLYQDHRAAVSVVIEGLLTQCHLASVMAHVFRHCTACRYITSVGRFWGAVVENCFERP